MEWRESSVEESYPVNARGPLIKGVEGKRSLAPTRRRYHQIRKVGIATSVAQYRPRDVIRGLKNDTFPGEHVEQGGRNRIAGEAVGSIQNPYQFDENFPADKSRFFGGERTSKTPCGSRLVNVVVDQISDQDVCVQGNHVRAAFSPSGLSPVAPSTIARSMSANVTEGPSCFNAPKRPLIGRTARMSTSPSDMTYRIRSPARTAKASRTAFGIVVCPLEVNADSTMAISPFNLLFLSIPYLWRISKEKAASRFPGSPRPPPVRARSGSPPPDPVS